MTSYFSIVYVFAFLPLTLLMYCIAPRRVRWAVLLGASYLFFWCISGALTGFIALSTVTVYVCGLGLSALLEKRDALLSKVIEGKQRIRKGCKRRMRIILVAGIIANIGMLVVLKYLGFFSSGVVSLCALFGVDVPQVTVAIGVPIGISFYTLMAVSYLVDVYRGTVRADRNLAHVALFLSFFPQIMEGPICRYGQTANDLFGGRPLTRQNLYEGSLRILWGLAKKIVVADRLNSFVIPVFENYANYDGGVIAFAAVVYTVQLYCDFSGTMDVAIGTARMFNVSLPENFRQPFFSRTASEFWKRWHITLGTWFKDYVYYPISLSKHCKSLTSIARKKIGLRYGPLLASSIALLAVWVGNGLWHGAGSQYMLFGMYYFVMIMAGSLIEPLARSAAEKIGVNRNSVPYRTFQIVRTLYIIFAGELIFRATSASAGLVMLAMIVNDFTLSSFAQENLFTIGVDCHDYAIVVVTLVIMLVIGIVKERGVNPCKVIAARHAVVRWGLWVLLILFIVVFGAYGVGYTPVDPMYAKF